MWKNFAELGRPKVTIWRMRIARRILKATNTHTDTGCVKQNATPLQQWSHGRASMLRYTQIACLVSCNVWSLI
jgi:hypothetical protein